VAFSARLRTTLHDELLYLILQSSLSQQDDYKKVTICDKIFELHTTHHFNTHEM